MKTKLDRDEIMRRALRAAGKVALMSTLACGGEAFTEPLQAGIPDPIGSDPMIAQPQVGDPGPDPVGDRVVEMIDARHWETRLSTVAATMCAPTDEKDGWEAYLACCDAIGWDWNRGCAAWGPPVPPSLEVA